VHRVIRYVRQHHVALVALFVALGGTSYAAIKLPAKSVGAKQIKKNAVSSAKVKDGSLRRGDFGLGELPAGPAGPAGPVGPTGAGGPPGPKGDQGPPFLPSVFEENDSSANDSNSPKSVIVSCPEGSLATGGYRITTETADAQITVYENHEQFPGISQWNVSAREAVAYAGNWQLQVLVNCIG
jgi:hypothetical protein